MLENVGGKWLTTAVGIGVEYFWIAAWLLLGLLGHEIVTWRNLVLATSAPFFLSFLLVYFVVPESPKWLFAVGRRKEAERILRKVAAKNGQTLDASWNVDAEFQNDDNDVDKDENEGNERPATSSFFDLFKYPNLRVKILVLWINWFANSMTYYGLTLNSGRLIQDWYLNFLMNGIMEIPAYTITIFIIYRLGRRFPCGITLILAGLVLLSLMFVPEEAVIAFAVAGKFLVTISFAVVYVYTAELLPTVLRSSGLGSSCFISRFGGMAASWVGLLASVYIYLPTSCYGAFAVVSGFLAAVYLPETNGEKMPDTVEESELVKVLKLSSTMTCCQKSSSSWLY